MFVIFSNYRLYTSNQKPTKHIHGFADTCTSAHCPSTHPHAAISITMIFPVTEPQLLYHESELEIKKQTIIYFKTCYKSENVDDGKTLCWMFRKGLFCFQLVQVSGDINKAEKLANIHSKEMSMLHSYRGQHCSGLSYLQSYGFFSQELYKYHCSLTSIICRWYVKDCLFMKAFLTSEVYFIIFPN